MEWTVFIKSMGNQQLSCINEYGSGLSFGEKLNILTNTCPYKSLKKIQVVICNHQKTVYMFLHDTEYPHSQ